jgi:hypothetical protein
MSRSRDLTMAGRNVALDAGAGASASNILQQVCSKATSYLQIDVPVAGGFPCMLLSRV